MEWLKENWFKLGLLLVLIGIASTISFYYLSYIPNRDQQKQIQEELASKRELETKKEQERKDYIVKRKNDCFEIYDKEKSNWGNVTGSEYNEEDDICYVNYKAQNGEWDGKDCKKFKPVDDTISYTAIWRWSMKQYRDCVANEFNREF